MDMQQAYAGADLGRLEERLAEAHREIAKLRGALNRIRAINDDPDLYSREIERVVMEVLDGRPS